MLTGYSPTALDVAAADVLLFADLADGVDVYMPLVEKQSK